MSIRIASRRPFAAKLTLLVLLLQAAVIGAFFLDPSDPPRSGSLWQALWALDHQASFIPLVACAVLAPPATLLAWAIRGPHRTWLVVGWILFGAVVAAWFTHRVWVMSNVVWEHGVR